MAARTKIGALCVAIAAVFLIAGCSDSDNPGKIADNNDDGGYHRGCLVKGAGSHLAGCVIREHPLKGVWHSVGSTGAYGQKVVFTDTTVTASHYANNYESGGTIYNYDEKWYDNAEYLLKNDTLEVLTFNSAGVQQSHPLKTQVVFRSFDTLEIKQFVPTSAAIPFPNNFVEIVLHRNTIPAAKKYPADTEVIVNITDIRENMM